MEQVKERTMTLACGALCALVFVSALFTPGQAEARPLLSLRTRRSFRS